MKTLFYLFIHPICLLVALIAWVGCSSCPVQPTPPDPEPVVSDARPIDCDRVCAHIRTLKCAIGQPTSGGNLCTHICDNIEDEGLIDWDLACMMRAKSCDEIDACVKIEME